MKDVFWTIAENHKVGFCPIQMPTGSGKTHSIIDFIFDYITSCEDGKIIFITSMKKNLPDGPLKEIFEKHGKAGLLKDTYLFLDSKEQTVLDNFKEDMVDAIDRVITDGDLTSDFFGLIESINSYQSSESRSDKKAESFLREKLRNNVEPRFRKAIRQGLSCFEGYNGKYNAVMNDPAWSWVSRLYPEVRTRDCRIIYMSADKFVMKNDTLVEKSYLICDSELIKDSIIFIDEFDSTKKVILNREIEMSVSRNLYYMKVANQIHSSMNNMDKHPEEMYVLSDIMAESETNSDDLKDFGRSVLKEFNRVFDKYNLEYKFIMNMPPDANDFLFYGHASYYITRGKNKYLSVTYDDNQRRNVVQGSDKKEEMYYFFDMFRELGNVFRYFFSFVRKLALNCKFVQNMRGTPIGYEYCVRSVLEIFDLDDDTIDYFISEILTMQSSIDKKSKAEDGSVYEKGFSVFSLKNGIEHVYNSAIEMISHNIMPEKILLKICSNSLVFGVSATATLDTVTGNYDLVYIKSRLKGDYIELNDEMKTRLRTQFERSLSGYKGNIKLDVRFISTSKGNGDYDSDIWNEICPNAINAEHIRGLLDRSDYDAFHKARYLRIAMVYHRFLLNEDIHSLLCFLNRHPREDSDQLNNNILEFILNAICSCYKDRIPKNFNLKKSLAYLNGENYDKKRDDLLKRLSKGEKIFVITAYNTLGAGQNIQYPVESQGNFVRINDHPLITESAGGRQLEKDFDAIYLDRPRNVIPFASENRKTKDIIEQIAITESLYERGEITISDEIDCIKSAFSRNVYDINRSKGICMNTASASNHAAGQIIQAVGRICRTSFKNPTIYIFVDEEVKDIFEKRPEYYGELLNYETKELLTHLCTTHDDERIKDRLINKGENRSRRATGYINRLRRGDWSEDDVQKWEQLRDHALKFPTTSEESDDIAYQYYVEMPNDSNKYWYSTNDDFRSIDIRFDNNFENSESVSEESARLKELLQIPGIRDMFEKEGYAISFKADRFMLSPPLFKNIYKGALGEVIGKKILSDKCGTDLVPLERDEYERFDFKTKNEEFYFDFKHWSSSGFVNSNIHEEIFKKMKETGAKKVFVVNILKPKFDCNQMIRSYEKEGLKILEIPYLYDTDEDKWNEEAIFGINKGMRI